jgi:hypothetical protein
VRRERCLTFLLLFGAGFSQNWAGWLSTAVTGVPRGIASHADRIAITGIPSQPGGVFVIRVKHPTSTAELDEVRALMRAFVAWHRERHVEDLALIDEYFDRNEFILTMNFPRRKRIGWFSSNSPYECAARKRNSPSLGMRRNLN